MIIYCVHILQVETFTAVTVKPALVLPIPVVSTDRGDTLHAYFKNCDFPVPTESVLTELVSAKSSIQSFSLEQQHLYSSITTYMTHGYISFNQFTDYLITQC